jgi:hypothetical protein
MERGTGFEPATIALEERDSTVELPPPKLSKSIPRQFRANKKTKNFRQQFDPLCANSWSLGPGLNR